MALVLDTDALPSATRANAIREATCESAMPLELTLPDDEPARARIHVWDLADGVRVMDHVGSGWRLERTADNVRRSPTNHLALTVLSGDSWRFDGARELVGAPRAPQLALTDLNEPHLFNRRGAGRAEMLLIDADHLGLTGDAIRHACATLDHSPLMPLLLQHVLDVRRSADDLDGAHGQHVARASVELLRTVMTTVDQPRLTAAVAALHASMQRHIRNHLGDPDLTAEAIAVAHSVSLRQVYKTFAAHHTTPGQAIAYARLEQARLELARPTSSHLTVAAVARRCGFTDPRHLAKRFRQAYGLTPTQWRRRTILPPPGPSAVYWAERPPRA